MTIKNTYTSALMATCMAAATTAAAAQGASVSLNQLKVFDGLPAGFWVIESGAVPANPLFPLRKEPVCASASDISSYLSGGMGVQTGAQANCNRGKTSVILNSALKAQIDLVCPGQVVAGVNFPDIKMTTHFKREQVIITASPTPALTGWTEDSGVKLEVKATYVGKDCPAR